MNLLALVPWYWRLGALTALAAALIGYGFVKGLERGEEKLEQFKEAIARAGDAQNARTAATIASQKTLVEMLNAQNDVALADRDAALVRVRALQRAGADRRLVPTAPAGAAGGDRICYARDQLDRGLREAVGRLQERSLAIAAEGQRGLDLAASCRDWARGLRKPN